MLSTRNLRHQYPSAQSFDFPDINCNPAETILVLGRSGVGKTTLLHILAGILTPTSGEVMIDGSSIYNEATSALDDFRGKNIGLIFQKPHFVSSLSAQENLLLAQKMAGTALDEQKIGSLLFQLNIDHRSTARTFEMSQGEQQRLSIARALVNNPKVILADEPTSALDDDNCTEVVNLLQQQAASVGAALVIVTHDGRLKELFHNQVILS